MVYYFRSITCEEEPEGYLLYMGKDKYENDDLIKYAWPEDVCPTPTPSSVRAAARVAESRLAQPT
jgi:hypothetical protein